MEDFRNIYFDNLSGARSNSISLRNSKFHFENFGFFSNFTENRVKKMNIPLHQCRITGTIECIVKLLRDNTGGEEENWREGCYP